QACAQPRVALPGRAQLARRVPGQARVVEVVDIAREQDGVVARLELIEEGQELILAVDELFTAQIAAQMKVAQDRDAHEILARYRYRSRASSRFAGLTGGLGASRLVCQCCVWRRRAAFMLWTRTVPGP